MCTSLLNAGVNLAVDQLPIQQMERNTSRYVMQWTWPLFSNAAGFTYYLNALK